MVNSVFKTEVIESGMRRGQDWQKVANKMQTIARMELGETGKG